MERTILLTEEGGGRPARRGFLRTAASATIAALAVHQIGAAGPLDRDPDAQLLAWGSRLDALVLQQQELRPSYEVAYKALYSRFDAWKAEHGPTTPTDQWLAAYTRISDEVGHDEHPIHDVWTERNELSELIGNAKATTFAGAAVQARLALDEILSVRDRTLLPGELEWEKYCLFVAVESICALVGVDAAGRPLDGRRA